MSKPIDSYVGQIVRAALLDGGNRMGMVTMNWRNGDWPIKVLLMWGYDPELAYYATEIIQDDALNTKQRLWVERQRKSFESYWQIMEMPRLRMYSNVALEEISTGDL